MCHLFETISIRNGIAENLPWHQDRIDMASRSVYGKKPDFKLALVIRIPIKMQSGHFRCRVDYDVDIKEIAFSPYIRKEIKSLKLVTDDSIEYPHKYSDRGRIEKLFESRDECDDILIVKNGLITDTSMANIIFRDGRRWVTPSEPLLYGTCRARLLDFGIITEARIKVSDLNKYNEAKIINALRDPNEFEAIPILDIKH